MNTRDILNALDAEIARLQQARNALAGLSSPKRSGRPTVSAPTAKKRSLSAAARKRIGDAQRKRWATQRAAAKTARTKAAQKKKVMVKKVPSKQLRERKRRVPKKAVVKHALSSKSEIVAAPKNNAEKS